MLLPAGVREAITDRIRAVLARAAVGMPWLGAALCLAYWLAVHPPSWNRLGYVEDIGGLETVRQMMAENLVRHGRPLFRTDQYFAPYGGSIPFMSWSIERDWIGAWIWLLDPWIPFFWLYFGVSLLGTYALVGWFLRRMGLTRASAWALAAFAAIFHLPRHYKIWHHFEHLPQHWIYLGVFFDAWIWQRLWREGRWSWSLELWRLFVMQGVFLSTGYHWGTMIIEWTVVRACLASLILWRLARRGVGSGAIEPGAGERIALEGDRRQAALAIMACGALFAFQFRWFSALLEEVQGIGGVFQILWYFAHVSRVFQPLWLEPLLEPLYWFFPTLPHLTPIDSPETVVTVGWVYWIPFFFSFWLLRRRAGGGGWGAMAPLALVLALYLRYVIDVWPEGYQNWIREHVPFMSFYRVASRMGLSFPVLLSACAALAWPELSRWVAQAFSTSAPDSTKGNGREPLDPRFAWRRRALAVFAFLSLLELTSLFRPVNAMPSMPQELASLLEATRQRPGDLVLDLPFCVAGGNGMCTQEQCPNYPHSTAGNSFHAYHEKRVFGLYQARMLDSHCQIYNRRPYVGWFDAWRAQRCFSPPEWEEFCAFLDALPTLSAVYLYPDIWVGAKTPGCAEEWERRLGPPFATARFMLSPTRGGRGANPTRVFAFGPRCRAAR